LQLNLINLAGFVFAGYSIQKIAFAFDLPLLRRISLSTRERYELDVYFGWGYFLFDSDSEF